MKDLAGEDLVKVLDVYHVSLRARAVRLADGSSPAGLKAYVALLVLAELVGAACDTIEAIGAMEADS